MLIVTFSDLLWWERVVTCFWLCLIWSRDKLVGFLLKCLSDLLLADCSLSLSFHCDSIYSVYACIYLGFTLEYWSVIGDLHSALLSLGLGENKSLVLEWYESNTCSLSHYVSQTTFCCSLYSSIHYLNLLLRTGFLIFDDDSIVSSLP